MSSKASFAEISPSELGPLYREGLSIAEIASKDGKSYTFTRNALLESGVELRSKRQGTVMYLERHPEWSHQFEKYKVDRIGELSPEKVLLVTLVITEGFVDPHTIGFANTQDQLHKAFSALVGQVYGSINVGRTGILSRVYSVQVSKDVGLLMDGKAFDDRTLRFVLGDSYLCAHVCRLVADTEGSMIISLRKAPRNFTVECRVVLASTNGKFVRQLWQILSKIGINSSPGVNGITIGRKEDILRFIQVAGFTPGIKVVRTKVGASTWFGREKSRLAALCQRIYREQCIARMSGLTGCFAECHSRNQLLAELDAWYDEPAEVMN